MTFSAPAYCSRCNRTYRFMDTMSSLCPRCSEAREGMVELKRDVAGAAFAVLSPRQMSASMESSVGSIAAPTAPLALIKTRLI